MTDKLLCRIVATSRYEIDSNLTDSRKFRLHQHVSLSSEGPIMTVIGFSPNGRIWCQWIEKDETPGMRLMEASFPPRMLCPVS